MLLRQVKHLNIPYNVVLKLLIIWPKVTDELLAWIFRFREDIGLISAQCHQSLEIDIQVIPETELKMLSIKPFAIHNSQLLSHLTSYS